MEIVICAPTRTPIGRYGGSLAQLDAAELGVHALNGMLERSGLDPAVIDDVVLGHCNNSSEAPAIGRIVALDAGLPVTVPGMHLDRRCGSGLQAVVQAAMQVGTGAADVVVAGGTESMSNATFYSTDMRWGGARHGVRVHDSLVRGRVCAGGRLYPVPGGMIETAENLRREYTISREEQDEFAVSSHRKAVQAQERGAFDEEIVPVHLTVKGQEKVVDSDEHPRPDVSIGSLSRLRPIMAADDPDATVTAGNASGQNDAAALCIVTSAESARRHGLVPLVKLAGWAVAGVEPSRMGIGPVAATEKALASAGCTLADIGLIELNEAFAAQALAVTREWGFGAFRADSPDYARLNVNGSGISLGHPVGATGARILGTLAYEMRRRGVRYGLETMCIGGGQGLAAVFEAV